MVAVDDIPETRRRSWRGIAPDERKSIRRQLILEAGVELLADGGPQAVSMRGVCRSARLTERYFYESFETRDEFLHTVFENTVLEARRVVEDSFVAHAGLAPAEVIRSVVRDLTDHLAADRRRGRILFVHSLSNELYPHGRELVEGFTFLIGVLLEAVSGPDTVTGPDRRWAPLAVFGAAAFVYQDWASADGGQTPVPDRNEVPDDREAVAGYLAGLICRLLGIQTGSQSPAGSNTVSPSGSEE